MRRVLRQVITGLVSIVRMCDGKERGAKTSPRAVALQPRADAATQRHWGEASAQSMPIFISITCQHL